MKNDVKIYDYHKVVPVITFHLNGKDVSVYPYKVKRVDTDDKGRTLITLNTTHTVEYPWDWSEIVDDTVTVDEPVDYVSRLIDKVSKEATNYRRQLPTDELVVDYEEETGNT